MRGEGLLVAGFFGTGEFVLVFGVCFKKNCQIKTPITINTTTTMRVAVMIFVLSDIWVGRTVEDPVGDFDGGSTGIEFVCGEFV